MERIEATSQQVMKMDAEHGVAFGFAIVCTEKGQPYVDLQDDIVDESVMLEAAIDFMKSARVAKEMHGGPQAGQVVFAFPLTADIAKALDIQTERTGLLIGIHFEDPEVRKKFVAGHYTGFSIGGFSEVRPVGDAA